MRAQQPITTGDVCYIQQHWEPLVAVAWAEHLMSGPGAVVIDRRVSETPQISYADQAMLLEQAIPDAVPDLLEHLTDYDPTSEVLFIVHRNDRTLGYQLRATEATPPDVYTQAQRIRRPPTA